MLFTCLQEGQDNSAVMLEVAMNLTCYCSGLVLCSRQTAYGCVISLQQLVGVAAPR